jgi:hypothetical protein
MSPLEDDFVCQAALTGQVFSSNYYWCGYNLSDLKKLFAAMVFRVVAIGANYLQDGGMHI